MRTVAYDDANSLPGPPLSADTAITRLVKAGVLVGIGVPDEYDAKNLRFEVGWVRLLLLSYIRKLSSDACLLYRLHSTRTVLYPKHKLWHWGLLMLSKHWVLRMTLRI